jgi:hypothetical protein
VNTDRIVDAIVSGLGVVDEPVIDEGWLEQIEGNLPGVVSVSASFIDQGVKVFSSFQTPENALGVTWSNPVAATEYLPGDTLALLSVGGIPELWEQIKEQIDADLLASEDASFDELVQDINGQVGFDIERDLIQWMTGEVALAVLPSNFSGDIPVVHVVALAEFNDRSATESALENIITSLEEQGLDIDQVNLAGLEAVTIDLDQADVGDYEPGYFLSDSHVVFGATRESLELAAKANADEIESLSQNPAFRRAREEIDGELDYLVYASIKGIVKASLDAVSATERAEYQDEASPFVDPLGTILIGGGSNEDITTFTLILTFD